MGQFTSLQILSFCRTLKPFVTMFLLREEPTRTWVWKHEDVFNLIAIRGTSAHDPPAAELESETFIHASRVIHTTSYIKTGVPQLQLYLV